MGRATWELLTQSLNVRGWRSSRRTDRERRRDGGGSSGRRAAELRGGYDRSFSSLFDFSQFCWALGYWATWSFEAARGPFGDNYRQSAGGSLSSSFWGASRNWPRHS